MYGTPTVGQALCWVLGTGLEEDSHCHCPQGAHGLTGARHLTDERAVIHQWK